MGACAIQLASRKTGPNQWLRRYVGIGESGRYRDYVAMSAWRILLVFTNREIIQSAPINNKGDE